MLLLMLLIFQKNTCNKMRLILFLYFLTFWLAYYLVRNNRSIIFLLKFQLILLSLIVCWRLFFLQVIFSENILFDTPIVFLIILVLLFCLRKSLKIFLVYKGKSLTKTNSFKILSRIIEQKNIFSRKMLKWSIEKKLYRLSSVFNLFDLKTIAVLFFFPYVFFYYYYFNNLLFQGSLIKMVSCYSFCIVYQTILIKVIIFYGIYGNLYNIHKETKQSSLDSSYNFYNNIGLTLITMLGINCGNQVFKYNEANLKPAIVFWDDLMLLYHKYFFPLLAFFSSINKLLVLKKKLFSFNIALFFLSLYYLIEKHYFCLDALIDFCFLFELFFLVICGFCLFKTSWNTMFAMSIESYSLWHYYFPNYEYIFKQHFRITKESKLNNQISFQDYPIKNWFTEKKFLFFVLLWLTMFFSIITLFVVAILVIGQPFFSVFFLEYNSPVLVHVFDLAKDLLLKIWAKENPIFDFWLKVQNHEVTLYPWNLSMLNYIYSKNWDFIYSSLLSTIKFLDFELHPFFQNILMDLYIKVLVVSLLGLFTIILLVFEESQLSFHAE